MTQNKWNVQLEPPCTHQTSSRCGNGLVTSTQHLPTSSGHPGCMVNCAAVAEPFKTWTRMRFWLRKLKPQAVLARALGHCFESHTRLFQYQSPAYLASWVAVAREAQPGCPSLPPGPTKVSACPLATTQSRSQAEARVAVHATRTAGGGFPTSVKTRRTFTSAQVPSDRRQGLTVLSWNAGGRLLHVRVPLQTSDSRLGKLFTSASAGHPPDDVSTLEECILSPLARSKRCINSRWALPAEDIAQSPALTRRQVVATHVAHHSDLQGVQAGVRNLWSKWRAFKQDFDRNYRAHQQRCKQARRRMQLRGTDGQMLELMWIWPPTPGRAKVPRRKAVPQGHPPSASWRLCAQGLDGCCKKFLGALLQPYVPGIVEQIKPLIVCPEPSSTRAYVASDSLRTQGPSMPHKVYDKDAPVLTIFADDYLLADSFTSIAELEVSDQKSKAIMVLRGDGSELRIHTRSDAAFQRLGTVLKGLTPWGTRVLETSVMLQQLLHAEGDRLSHAPPDPMAADGLLVLDPSQSWLNGRSSASPGT